MKSFHHICIQTENYNESLNFYTNIIGFQIHKETKNFHGRDYNTWLKLNDFYIELQTPKKGETLNKWDSKNAGPVHICILVEDVKQEYLNVKNKGYTSFKKKNGEELYLVEDSYLFKIKAPEGTEVEIRDVAYIS